jgi:lipopolysaccharide export system protein LptC
MQRIRDAWERFLLYVPLTVMAVLALGTYWLVHSTAEVSDPVVLAPVRHEPDYFMRGFSVRNFDASGLMRTEVSGEEVRHYPDTQWLEIDSIRVRSFDAQGHLTTAAATRGLAKEDASEVQLLGHAMVLREAADALTANPAPRMEYHGEYLHAFITAEKIQSNQPVELIRGMDRFTADSMNYDNAQQVLQLEGRVRGTLAPQSHP